MKVASQVYKRLRSWGHHAADSIVISRTPYSLGLTTWKKGNETHLYTDGWKFCFLRSYIYFRPFPCKSEIRKHLRNDMQTTLEAVWKAEEEKKKKEQEFKNVLPTTESDGQDHEEQNQFWCLKNLYQKIREGFFP